MLLAAGLVLTLGSQPAVAKSWEGDEQNVMLEISEGGNPWDWLPFNSAWGKLGIIKGAKRELTKLKNGKPATGQGALMHLAVRDAPDGATIKKTIAAPTANNAINALSTPRFSMSVSLSVESSSAAELLAAICS